MAIIPNKNKLKDLLESGLVDNEHRPHLGYSELGHPCHRKLWYSFHWAYKDYINQRVQRIFNRGDAEEEIVVKDLERAGLYVFDRQLELHDDTGHILGHIDGLVSGVPGSDLIHLLEVKTMNRARFLAYVKKGLKETNPGYYVQYNMYLGKLGLTKCLYIVTNKDNEERDYRVLEFDKQCYEDHKRIGFEIIAASEPARKVGKRTWHVCKMCDASTVCHDGIRPQKNCRTCENVSILQDGFWQCDKTEKRLSVEEQRKGCDSYEVMACLS